MDAVYRRKRWLFAAALAAVAACIATPASAQLREPLRYVAVGEVSRPPIGWVQFSQA